jgi:hypothetical protein
MQAGRRKHFPAGGEFDCECHRRPIILVLVLIIILNF